MQNLASIMIGVDFSAGAAAAVREALRIADWNRSRVTAMHVIDTHVVMDLEQALSAFQIAIREQLIEEAHAAWTKFAATIPGAPSLPFDVKINNRVVGLLTAARAAASDLLVLGANGEHSANVGIGTVATACVRHSPCDALLVREAQSGPFRKIVACVDFSPTSLRALQRAARIAAQDEASLDIVHVFDAPWNQLNYRSLPTVAPASFEQAHLEALKHRLESFAAELGEELKYLKPTMTIFEHRGHRPGLVAYAASVDADLIVLGTRGTTNVRDLLLGSTAEKVLRHSSCSILAVKPDRATPVLVEEEPVAAPSPQTRPPQ